MTRVYPDWYLPRMVCFIHYVNLAQFSFDWTFWVTFLNFLAKTARKMSALAICFFQNHNACHILLSLIRKKRKNLLGKQGVQSKFWKHTSKSTILHWSFLKNIAAIYWRKTDIISINELTNWANKLGVTEKYYQ